MPILKDMLTLVARTGIMSRAQSLSNHVGMASSSQDDLTGDNFKSTPVSVAGSDAVSRLVWGSPSV